MKKNRHLWILALALFNTGCATMFSKSVDQISIQTDPIGSEVYYHLEKLGETPVTFKLESKTLDQPFIVLKKPGFQVVRINLEKIINKTALFNFGFVLTSSGATSFEVPR